MDKECHLDDKIGRLLPTWHFDSFLNFFFPSETDEFFGSSLLPPRVERIVGNVIVRSLIPLKVPGGSPLRSWQVKNHRDTRFFLKFAVRKGKVQLL